MYNYLPVSGMNKNFWDLLSSAQKRLEENNNCFLNRIFIPSICLQVEIELVVTAISAIFRLVAQTAVSLLEFNLTAFKKKLVTNALTLPSAVFLAVVLPFYFLAAMTIWPKSILAGLSARKPEIIEKAKDLAKIAKLEEELKSKETYIKKLDSCERLNRELLLERGALLTEKLKECRELREKLEETERK